MSFVTTNDGVEIFFKDWGPKNAQPIIFSHGWPLRTADAWDAQILRFFAQNGYRVVAHDRRGHGRSDTPLKAIIWTAMGPTTWPSSSNISICRTLY